MANLAKVAKHLDLSSSPLLASPPPSPSPSPSPSPRRVRGTHNSLDYWRLSDLHRVRVLPDVRSRQRWQLHRAVLLNDMDAFCMADYGISQPEIAASVTRSNAFYGADRPRPRPQRVADHVCEWRCGPVEWAGASSDRQATGYPRSSSLAPSHHAWTHPTLSHRPALRPAPT